ncbi:MAG: radical SAM protein [Candidatus Methanomethylophilaceae archaeon]|jgi:uncharacterized radical SAM superfamily protein
MGIPKDKLTSCSLGKKFLSISVTGGKCRLNCSHCQGKYLEGMLSVRSPDDLLNIAADLRPSGNGILISGGCDKDGKVPLRGYLPTIRKISDSGLKVNLHPGIMTEDDIVLFSGMNGVCLSVDVHQDPKIIKDVFKLKGPEVYRDTLNAALSAGCDVMPHLTVGLSDADLKESAGLVKEKGIKNIVLLALVPTEGTPYENNDLTEDGVVDAVRFLIDMGFTVTLGCMRDRRMRTLEKRAIKEGVRKIANMSLETELWAKSEGYEIFREEMCCCFSE